MTRVTLRSGVFGDGVSLGAGAALNGLFAYGFLLVGSRSFGVAFAPVSSVWSVWALTAAAVTVPTHHSVLRRAVSQGRSTHLRSLLVPAIGAGLVVSMATWPYRSHLFSTWSLIPPLVCGALVPAAALLGWWRGSLSSEGRYGRVGVNLAMEGGVRLGTALVLIALNAPPVALALAILSGYLPTMVTLAASRAGWRSEVAIPEVAIPEVAIPEVELLERPQANELTDAAFSAGVVAVALAVQVAQTVPVLSTSARATRADVVGLFNLIAIGRVPLLIGGAALFRLTHWLSEGAPNERALRARSMVGWASAPVLVLSAGAGALLGPPLLPVLFGPTSQTSSTLAALVGAASAAALLATAGAVVLAVQHQGWRLMWWSVASVGVGATVALGVPADVAVRGASGYLTVTLLLLAGALLISPGARDLPTAKPGSTVPPVAAGGDGNTRRVDP